MHAQKQRLFVRFLIAVAMAVAIAAAYYTGGVVGFVQGFQRGADLTQITAGGQVLMALEGKPGINTEILHQMLDQALLSYQSKKTLGTTSFDLIGAQTADPSVERLIPRIAKYRLGAAVRGQEAGKEPSSGKQSSP